MGEQNVMKGMRKRIEIIGLALIINMVVAKVLFNKLVILFGKFHMKQLETQLQRELTDNEILEMVIRPLDSNGWIEIICELGALVVIMLLFHKLFSWRSIFEKKQVMTAKNLSMLVVITFAVQGLATIVNALFCGWENAFLIDSGEKHEIVWSMIVYSVLIAPILEEVLYRGMVLTNLERYGKGFAIVASALLFALIHNDVSGILFGFAFGIITGYITAEYSIVWSIGIHIINNLCCELWEIAKCVMPGNMASVVWYGGNLIFLILGAIVIVRKYADVKQYYNTNKENRSVYRVFFTSVCVLLFIAIHIISKIGVV